MPLSFPTSKIEANAVLHLEFIKGNLCREFPSAECHTRLSCSERSWPHESSPTRPGGPQLACWIWNWKLLGSRTVIVDSRWHSRAFFQSLSLQEWFIIGTVIGISRWRVTSASYLWIPVSQRLPNFTMRRYHREGLFKTSPMALTGGAQLVGRHPANRKAASWSGDMAGLQVQSPVRACMEGNQLMFLSYRLMFVSLSFSLPLPFSKKQKTPSS